MHTNEIHSRRRIRTKDRFCVSSLYNSLRLPFLLLLVRFHDLNADVVVDEQAYKGTENTKKKEKNRENEVVMGIDFNLTIEHLQMAVICN